jgi:hypothetical protein
MGAVHVAFDERLDRRVAIKLLHQTEMKSELVRERVLREAQAMARVSHANVVPIYEVGEADEQIFIAMEYVDGTTLKEWQKQPRPWQEVLRMYLEAGQGLRAAHEVGLIHRDFKADNVLIGKDGRLRVADFGLARLGAGRLVAPGSELPAPSGDRLAAPLTVVGAISGTPGYMYPEQYQAADVDASSDQFSFCASLFEALYRRLPYAGDTLVELAANTLAGKLEAQPAGSQVPIEVHVALVRGPAVDPAKRFASMAALLAALALEQGHTAAGVSMSRRRAGYLFAFCIVVLHLMTRINGWEKVPAPGSDLLATAAASLILGAIGVALRKTLYRNAFHRRIFTLGMVILLQKLLLGILGASFSLSFRVCHALDLVTLAAACTLFAFSELTALFWVPAAMLLAAAALVRYGDAAVPYTFSLFPIVAAATVLAWNSAAERAHRESWQTPQG